MLKPFILPYLPNDKKIIIIGSFADRGIILNDLVKMGNDLGATTVIFPNICHIDSIIQGKKGFYEEKVVRAVLQEANQCAL